MAKILTQPLLILLFFMTAGAVLSWIGSRFGHTTLRRLAVIVAALSLVLLLALSTPAVASLLRDSLTVPSDAESVPDYIVVLAGGYSAAASPDLDVLSSESMQRVLAGVHDWKQHPSARLVMTGTVPRRVRDAGRITELMADVAICRGVPPAAILRETTARNTREHPPGVLRLPGVTADSRLAIVTSRIHERRAVMEFRRYFRYVVAAPIPQNYSVSSTRLDDWIPQNDGLTASTAAIQEWVGIAWYRLLALRSGRPAWSR